MDAAGAGPCRVVAVGDGRRAHQAHEAPAFGTSLRTAWRR